MDTTLDLTSDESNAIVAALTSFSKRAKFHISLDYLLEGWAKFVTEVEEGYDDSIFDYTNSLSKRDFLEELLRQLPQSLRDKLLNVLQPWDTRFREATREVEEAVLPTLDNTRELGYWWYRVPKKLKEPIYDPTHWGPYYT